MTRILTLAMFAMLTGCVSGVASGGIAPGQEFSLDVGQRAVLPDASTLHYAGISNDSRCPPNVQCIRAGDADVLFDHMPAGGKAHRVVLNTERTKSADVGPWQLQLLALQPGERPRVTLVLQAP
ncbi:hypothetical protein [Agrilutibacter solisilvae]|uniref:Lipoprotein n=1 Tax=Agrilutibacter solisilvae TaxID=2763317 RepID=A0A974XYE3_9GAMM|nr:hypothetical protein [Lysobacter solisilvae]QSX77145.1 hypothetical protein I8J32_010030 [Lysobacter solisilvae]